MSSGFYVDRDTALHRLHPVTRIVLLLLSFASTLIVVHPVYALVLVFIYGLVGVRSGALTNLRRIMWLLVLIAIGSFFIWSLIYPGEDVVYSSGPLRVTREGMLFGAGMGVRLDLMVFCGLIFLATTPVEEFTYGMTRMGIPFPVSFAMSLSFRLVPLFSDTVRTILDAQRARGLDTEAGGLSGRLKSYTPLLVPVFASAMRRTDQLAIALESKGFGRGRTRGSYREFKAGAVDAVAVTVMGVIIIIEILARVLGMGGVG